MAKRRLYKLSQRSGSIYAVVLLTSLLVGTIGLAALQLQRVQSRSATESGSFAEARIYARAAVEMGMLKIRNDAYWRTRLGNGLWISNQSIGSGKISLSAADPIDNDVTRGENHPVILTGTGIKGTASFSTSVRLEVGPRVGSCLEVSMISGHDTSITVTNLTSDQTVSSNNNYNAGGGAVINSNVEAKGSIGGSTYNGTKTTKLDPRDMPDPLHALDYYLANGTTIQYSDFPQWRPTEMLTNTKFETDTLNWYASGGTCVFQRSSIQAKEGIYSLFVKSRSVAAAVATQDVPVSLFTHGNTYEISIPVFPSAVCTAQAVLTLTSDGSGVQVYSTPPATLQKNALGEYTWKDLKGSFQPSWSGTLTKATVSISMSVKNNYYMDKVSLVDTTFPTDDYIMDKQLLSPSVNPFGSRQTNTSGIYIINCAGKDVVVGRMRIVGTLVFVNPGGNAQIAGPVSWEPAVYNYPALLSNNTISATFGTTALSESDVGVNLNPTGTPFPYLGGASNATLTDTYPNKITGLIYSRKDLELHGAPVLSGAVIVKEDLKIDGTTCTMNYVNTYLNDPPPGFDVGTIKMKAIAGTWQRTVN